ncbi:MULTISPECIES: phosphoketolase family protein [unclassified Paenibacillus]|uniref:phosphoketolase family protein n=1 Tax=unclassified Paenibacillus TaxID=185978 RepID=UPI002405DDCA|nr:MULTISPECIES: phosphoketolase family protein [unclassified Paenibacillus]MDF9841542.1 xylulose-5-phosphate/fructose-6-phosphate phosphoketolase [Paenibacillus sp. PastF-2]MDF9848346.1 xylulose-5-phosphate/fructose-6-phosphate phosphoketolase [Paenibacillus sp. PastM-2]MDF9854700.1 xylulose-5-phosphate/fructose-6-phosphate phosphoketolase [Paenibacillus sp. PastF-1]MDH6479971.1 xylulose-5-phosphate/fructose-6-phosphate phosphoketolase [Paenibacillus sp. PastH-2]MDH6507405.1 xylulose-5-phosph
MGLSTMNVDYSSKTYLEKLDAYWRATNYISVGQLYLKDNPLLREPLKDADVKIKPIGHWGTIPGQNFIYAHLNRVITKYDLNMFYIEGPGHGGQVMVSNSYLDGSYTEIYPDITQDIPGLKKLFKQFSFPGGVASHAAPETPGSIHEGGELGYSLSHGAGAILDNPDLISAVVIGDGEAETGPLAASWFSNRFINPVTDGAVLPILHLNGFKISNPTILSRQSREEITAYFTGMGWEPFFVEGEDPERMHPEMAKVLDTIVERIAAIQKNARENNDLTRPLWPMLVFRSPKGWTGPAQWDGVPNTGSFRAHQVPIPVDQKNMKHAPALLDWMHSYRPEELFDENGRLFAEIAEILPTGNRRMGMNPVTNAGNLIKDLNLPDFADYALDNAVPGQVVAQDMAVLGKYLKEVVLRNEPNRNFRIFGPDETMSNRLAPVFEVTKRQWLDQVIEPNDEFLASYGRVIDSQLSEHQAEGLLEGYVLTGRHGFFHSYEAFLRVVDSMITQHFKWLRKATDQGWRADIPSLNVVATSTVFQQDHNGYTHQDPGLLGHLADKKPEFIREYLPADANSLLAVFDTVLNDRQKINLIVSSKHPRPQWFSVAEAQELVDKGLKIIDWASTDKGGEPDVVFASAGTEPTIESLAAISILNEKLPELKIRYINVVDLLKLRSQKLDPRGLSDEEFDQFFTKDKPVIFAFHGYEGLIKDLFFDRHNHNLHVHGYRENGDITTPFDMRVLNQMDRFDLTKEAVLSLPESAEHTAIAAEMDAMVKKHYEFIREEGIDLPEVESWVWKGLK